MPSAKCHRCAAKLDGMAPRTLSAPLPVLLIIEGKSQSGVGKVCGSCMRRVNEHWQGLREKPGPMSRATAAMMPPAPSERKKAVRPSEVECLQAEAKMDTSESLRTRKSRDPRGTDAPPSDSGPSTAVKRAKADANVQIQPSVACAAAEPLLREGGTRLRRLERHAARADHLRQRAYAQAVVT